MRIVDRATFLALPSGTVYAKWGEPGDTRVFDYGPTEIKLDTMGGDFVSEPFFAWPDGCNDSGQWIDEMEAARSGNATAPMAIGDSSARDGLYDEAQMFAVYDRTEVERLIGALQQALAGAYPPT